MFQVGEVDKGHPTPIFRGGMLKSASQVPMTEYARENIDASFPWCLIERQKNL